MPRPKKYTGAKLERACNAYLDSISYFEPVTRSEPTGKYNKKGYPIYEDVPVKNARGEELSRRVYICAPSLTGLALYLRVDRTTVSEYGILADREGATDDERRMCAAVRRVKAEIEQYNIELLAGRSARGAMFNLNCNFGWSEKQNINLTGGSVEEYLKSVDREKKDADNSYEY